MQKQQQIILIIGIALALIAVVLTKIYLDQQRQNIVDRAKKELEAIQANQTAVLVAAKAIAKGSAIESDSLEVQVVPNKFLQPQAVTSLDRIAGMTVAVDISKGEQITLNKLMSAKETQAGGSLAMVTPVGKRAVGIPIDNISSIGGMIRPGDYVDVIGIIPVPVQSPTGEQQVQATTMPLFQNILVLAVGRQLGSALPTGSRYKAEDSTTGAGDMITLALSPQEANLFAFVLEQNGKVRLTLRSPADSKIEAVPPANWDSLFRYVMPQAFTASSSEEELRMQQMKKGRAVEIYRGLKKEVVPLAEEK